jgi:hypothetical protein
MRIEELLTRRARDIVEEVSPAVACLEHYHRDGVEATRQRLEELHRAVAEAVRTRDVDGLVDHARRIAEERFAAGFTLAEVERAFAELERATARRLAAELPNGEVAWGVALVATAFAHATEGLERSFASLARPVTDLSAVFRRSGATKRERFSEELVHPI